MSVISRLANLHEEFIASVLRGRKTKASGSQWNDPGDGRHNRHNHLTPFAFGWDCKCAMPGTKSISITRDMLDKIIEQAGGERPMIPLRFYATERGAVQYDWLAMPVSDLVEMIEYMEDLVRQLGEARA